MLYKLICPLILVALFATIKSEPIPIVSGIPAEPLELRNEQIVLQNSGQYPYVVFVDATEGHCVGALVRGNVVLTAAHCNVELNTKVIAGVLDLHEDPPKYKQVRHAKSVIKHQKYKRLTSGNVYDIAVVWVSLSFSLNKYVNIIKLAKKDHTGATAFVLGWGRTRTTKYSSLLLRANLEILTTKDCKSEFKTLPEIEIKDSMLCARDPEKKQTPCKGDSGGPLVIRNVKGVSGDVLVGLSSWVLTSNKKMENCNPNYPTAFTRITKIRSWIKITADI